MKITVVGAGHVGLALAVMLAERHEVVLLEVDERRVQQVNSGQCPVGEPEMQPLLGSGALRLRATMDRADAYAGAQWVLIATPTDYTEAREGFDTSSVESVVEHSHNYTLKTLFRRERGHGMVYFQVLKEPPSALREGIALARHLVRDLLYAIRHGRPDTIPFNVAYRATFNYAHFSGRRAASRSQGFPQEFFRD